MFEKEDTRPPEHEQNGMGICNLDCPACTINRHKHLVMREKLGYGPEPQTPTLYEHQWLAAQHISWYGDLR
jgi:hypothetical protein